MKILAASDIHLGRLPTHGSSNDLPWDAVVNTAIEYEVNVLVLAGDIIEHERYWLSSIGAIDAGLAKLKDAKIKVFAVGGNHDWHVLPYLASLTEEITILGFGGTWQSYEYDGVHFVGYSFPRAHNRVSPLASFDSALVAEASLSLGILHGDLDVPSSAYGPLQRHKLAASGVDLWALGHIHTPGYFADAKSFYCGSPYALDPSETGERGVYLIEKASARAWKEPRFLPISPIRYETLPISVTDLDSLDAIGAALNQAARERLHESDVQSLYLQPLFTGLRNPMIELEALFAGERGEVLIASTEGRSCYVRTKIRNETSMAIDLEEVAKGSGSDAILAKLIADEEWLLSCYKRVAAASYNGPAYRALEPRTESDEAMLASAKTAAMTLLQAMVKQRREVER